MEQTAEDPPLSPIFSVAVSEAAPVVESHPIPRVAVRRASESIDVDEDEEDDQRALQSDGVFPAITISPVKDANMIPTVTCPAEREEMQGPTITAVQREADHV